MPRVACGGELDDTHTLNRGSDPLRGLVTEGSSPPSRDSLDTGAKVQHIDPIDVQQATSLFSRSPLLWSYTRALDVPNNNMAMPEQRKRNETLFSPVYKALNYLAMILAIARRASSCTG